MNIRSQLRWFSLAALSALGALAACGGADVGPSSNPPAALNAATDLNRTAPVGTPLANAVVVTVTDASGRPVQNAAVALSVTIGNGTINPRVAMTDAHGQAAATWTLGTIVGANEVTATVAGVGTQLKFEATGTAGAVTAISFTPQSPRLLPTVETFQLTAQGLDAFGNVTTPTPTFVVRDPSLISVDASGFVRALRRGSVTYVLATAGAKTDSVLVTVLAVGQSVCMGLAATPLDLSLGQVVTDVSGTGFCVHASSPSAEYAVIPYFNSGVPSATVTVEVRGQGLTPLSLPAATIVRSNPGPAGPAPVVIPDEAFESRMRAQERSQSALRRAAGGQSGPSARMDIQRSANAAVTVPAVGDLLKLNTNAINYCDNPDVRVGRVAAVTDKAIVVADTANPIGGFTDAEYRSIGVTFDTLVDPVDRAAFGAVTDIDNNGHVILFFTRAVNELTAQAASSVVLGFFYGRDLLPKTGTAGTCAGSNVGEMFYLMVPDTGGVVNSNKRSKALVVSLSNGTVAHEYQHLINASRRMYVNGAGNVTEEKWLDEGLAHVAEELNFFRAAGVSPRSNIDATPFPDPKFLAAFNTFQLNNFRRYAQYLPQTATQSPIGFDALDDDLPTRGAIWNFLRYAADHLPAGQENAFWTKLVNSTTSGVANLTNALGAAPNGFFRDWAISVFMDDNAPNVDPRFQQPSWNMRSALPYTTSLPFPLATRTLSDNTPTALTLAGNGVSFFRFSVANGQEAFFTVTSNGQPLPATVQLSVVRVK
ncbi:MAG: hypothetical protein JWM41_171 [Gemmatimonadetes bacterium]|nr:hypothetical protein [Gemmatimonadota bacterium]